MGLPLPSPSQSSTLAPSYARILIRPSDLRWRGSRRSRQRIDLREWLAACDRRGKHIEVQLVCRVRIYEDGKYTTQNIGEQIAFDCPNSTAARYIRRRLDALARELDGALVLADEVQPRKR